MVAKIEDRALGGAAQTQLKPPRNVLSCGLESAEATELSELSGLDINEWIMMM